MINRKGDAVLKKKYLPPQIMAVDPGTECIICTSTLDGYDEYGGEPIIIE